MAVEQLTSTIDMTDGTFHSGLELLNTDTCNVGIASMYSLFWDVMQRRLVVSNRLLGQPVVPVFKGDAA